VIVVREGGIKYIKDVVDRFRGTAYEVVRLGDSALTNLTKECKCDTQRLQSHFLFSQNNNEKSKKISD